MARTEPPERDTEQQGPMRISSEDRPRMNAFGRFLVTMLILASIAGITLLIAVRTTGGRQFICSSLEKRTGAEWTIGSAKIGWPYDLVLEDLATKETAPSGDPLVSIRELRVGWRGRTWRIFVLRCAANTVKRPLGDWNPGFLARVGTLRGKDAAEITRLTAGFRKRTHLTVRDSSVRWLRGSGDSVESANGVFFSVIPLKAGERRLYYYRLAADAVIGGDGVLLAHDVEREWLATEDRDYIEIDRSASGDAGGDAGLWTGEGGE